MKDERSGKREKKSQQKILVREWWRLTELKKKSHQKNSVREWWKMNGVGGEKKSSSTKLGESDERWTGKQGGRREKKSFLKKNSNHLS